MFCVFISKMISWFLLFHVVMFQHPASVIQGLIHNTMNIWNFLRRLLVCFLKSLLSGLEIGSGGSWVTQPTHPISYIGGFPISYFYIAKSLLSSAMFHTLSPTLKKLSDPFHVLYCLCHISYPMSHILWILSSMLLSWSYLLLFIFYFCALFSIPNTISSIPDRFYLAHYP